MEVIVLIVERYWSGKKNRIKIVQKRQVQYEPAFKIEIKSIFWEQLTTDKY